MWESRRITSLEELQDQPFAPPEGLLELAEEWEETGRAWLAMWAAPGYGEPRTWMLVDAGTGQGRLYLEDEDERVEGTWSPGYGRFHAEEGPWFDLTGQAHREGEEAPEDPEDEEEEELPLD